MKPTVSLLCAALVPLLACGTARAQDTADAPSKPVLASTYVAPPKPPAAPAPAVQPEAKPAHAAAAAPSRPGFVPLESSDAEAGEPNVKYIVIDSDGTHIEELRIRGVSQKLTVQTRLGLKEGYEIIMGDGSRDLSPGANTSRGATGQSVWHVLSF